MDQLIIQGGAPLTGTVRISGAKNAALPMMCAALLTAEECTLRRVPRLRDIRTIAALLRDTGIEVQAIEADTYRIRAREIPKPEAPYELVKTMRASVLVLGPLLARRGRARVSLPGGCAIGARPIDMHLEALERMGAVIGLEHGDVVAHVPEGRLKGASITLELPTVTGTENILMAATLAEGQTTIRNAAREPEVTALGEMLIAMGARIEGLDTATITVEGVESLSGCAVEVIADRIETGTYLAAVGLTGGEIVLEQTDARHVESVIDKLRETGLSIEVESPTSIRVRSERRPAAADVRTAVYPGFATDMQAQFMALVCLASGTSVITETIFENRFMHVNELLRMGADIELEGRTAVIKGVERLGGAHVMATDLRASAGLVLAGLAADGQTHVHRVYHLDRGYEQMEVKLKGLGARIERARDELI